MRSCESQVLKMMERTSRRPFRPTQYSFRKHTYLAQLTIAYELLNKYEFDHVIFNDIPHEPFGFILHCLCKVLKIKPSFFWQLQLKDSFLHSESISRLFDTLNLTEAELANKEQPELPEHLQLEYDERNNCEHPWYIPTKKPNLIKRIHAFYRLIRIRKILSSLPSWWVYTRIKKNFPTKRQTLYLFRASHATRSNDFTNGRRIC